jgi:hypothetical protein
MRLLQSIQLISLQVTTNHDSGARTVKKYYLQLGGVIFTSNYMIFSTKFDTF